MARCWFRPKCYGYGATPVTWEGWLATFGVCGGLAGSIVAMQVLVARSNFVAWMAWAAVVVGVTLWFGRVARRRTDGEWRWRWGEDSLRPKH